eukprot:scaffold25990_cov53-Attheya_sp.AAC.1
MTMRMTCLESRGVPSRHAKWVVVVVVGWMDHYYGADDAVSHVWHVDVHHAAIDRVPIPTPQ